MKRILICSIVALLVPAICPASQWQSPHLCWDVNTEFDDYALTVASDGDLYKRDRSFLYLHSYAGSYNWEETGDVCNGFSDSFNNDATINPDKTEGYMLDVWDIYYITSSNGVNWSVGMSLSGWERSPEYPFTITCAWWDSHRWLYVAYGDGIVWGAPYPYNNPQEIDVGGLTRYITVSFSGDYLVVQGWNGSDFDLYELYGYGSNWDSRSLIDEVSSEEEERAPVLGKIDAEQEKVLFFSRPGYSNGYEVYYSTGSSTYNITSDSLGKIKALLR